MCRDQHDGAGFKQPVDAGQWQRLFLHRSIPRSNGQLTCMNSTPKRIDSQHVYDKRGKINSINCLLSVMNIQEIAGQLAHKGYIVLENPLEDPLMTVLLARCQDDGRFQSAYVGRGRDKKQIASIRGDKISWLDDRNCTDASYLALMEELRMRLNEKL